MEDIIIKKLPQIFHEIFSSAYINAFEVKIKYEELETFCQCI